MILRKIPFVNKNYSPGGLPVVAAWGGQRICSKIQSEDDEYSDALEVAASAEASILAKFVLFEYNHVVIAIKSQYRKSDFCDLGWERVSLTILMSQYDQKPITFWYDIIMYIISMQSEIYLLNLYLSC